MEAKTVEVERSWGWIVDGWSLFMKNPAVWILMILIFAVVMILLSFVPILGVMASALLGTMLAGGLLYGAFQLDNDGALEVLHLFQSFRDANLTAPMFILGLVSLVASLVMGVVSIGLIGGLLFGGGMQVGAYALIGLLLLLLLGALFVALLFYAVPLVMFKGIAPFEAIKFSFMGSIKNWLPLLVFFLIYAVLAVLAAIPFGLGFLVLGPVMAGAWYQSYKDFF